MNRRSFLKALGLGTGGSWPMKLWASSDSPKRIVFFYTHHGTWYDGWKMRWGGQSENHFWTRDLPTSSSEYSTALSPLSSFRDKMIVIDGLALVSAELDGSGLRHELGQIHSLTGANIELLSGVPLASQASLDQIIADKIADEGQFKSLEYGVGSPSMSVNYGGAKMLLPFSEDPIRAHQRLLGWTSDSMALQSALMSRQETVLLATSERYGSIAQDMGRAAQRKMENHRALLGDLSKRLEGLDALRAQCSNDLLLSQTGSYDLDFEAFAHLISAAFSCDLTRVATLHMGQMSGTQIIGQEVDIHNDYAHAVWASPIAQNVMTLYTQKHAAHMSYLLSLLDGVVDPFGDGIQTLLDNTMVVWLGELGDGAHGFNKWPVVVVGGSAFSDFQYGKYIHYPAHLPVFGWSYEQMLSSMGVPHQHFLVSVAQQFGLERNWIGEQELLLSDGSVYRCVGPLQGLV